MIRPWLGLGPRSLITVLVILGACAYTSTLARHAVRAVGGSDSTGYLNAARMLAQGSVVAETRTLAALELEDSRNPELLPLGFVPGPRPRTMAPFYPPGFPALIAASATVLGWEAGPWAVPPLFAGIGVVLMYALALAFGLSPPLAAGCALLLAVWPVYASFGVQLMSDTVATTWVIAAVLLAMSSGRGRGWSAASGCALAAAIALRPTSALAAIPIALVSPRRWSAVGAFVAGAVPIALLLAAYNQTAYGSPLATGYAWSLGSDLALSFFPERFVHYLGWLATTLTPLLPAAWLGLALDRRLAGRHRAALLGWFAAFLLFHCVYRPYEAWWYLRFLAPAVPALIIGGVICLRDVTAKAAPPLRGAVLALLLGGMVVNAAYRGHELQLVPSIGGLYLFPLGASWVRDELPDGAIVAAMETSGALHAYTDALYARWDLLDPESFESLRVETESRGHRWYALVLPHEVQGLRDHLPGAWQEVRRQDLISLWRLPPIETRITDGVPVAEVEALLASLAPPAAETQNPLVDLARRVRGLARQIRAEEYHDAGSELAALEARIREAGDAGILAAPAVASALATLDSWRRRIPPRYRPSRPGDR